MGAMPQQDIFEVSPTLGRSLSTSDFTLDSITAVEPDGEAEVFDLSVDDTENFVANGLVTHNTWWNDDDLAGRLQQHMAKVEDADQFVVIKYPAIAESYEYRHIETMDVLRTEKALEGEEEEGFQLLRNPGDPLHAARYPIEALKRIRATLDRRIWSALYQQNPVPDEGVYFRKEYFRYAPTLPPVRGMNVVSAWDFAITEKQKSDWTVGSTILQDHRDALYVAEVERFKADTYGIIGAMLDMAERWMSRGADYVLAVEDGQIWKTMEPVLRRAMIERRVFPSILVLRPLTDKLARARPLQGRMQQGRVTFPEDAPWLMKAEQELLRFPAGAHDDIVDSLAWGTRATLERQPPAPPREGRQLKSWRDRIEMNVRSGSHMSA